MVETGKRSRSNNEQQSGDNRNNKKRGGSKDENDDGHAVVYRILCPEEHIGSVIGKGGKMVKSIRNETGAKVTVVDPHPGAKERVVILHCHVLEKEEVEIDDGFADKKPLCSSQSALFKVHTVITETVSYPKDSEKNKDYAECHLLVPSSQVANIIGKSGSIIKKLRSKTKANITITAKDPMDPSHSCANDFDNFVKVTGEVEAVRQAVFGISAIMYKFSPREDIPLEKSVPGVHPPSFIIPSDVPMYPPGGSFYPTFDTTAQPGPILPSSHAPELPLYPDPGNVWPVYPSGFGGYAGGGGPSRSEELVLRLLCPMDKIGRVIGKSGASIKALRQTTGASVEVDDSKNSTNEECAITIKSNESTDDRKSMAVDVVLLLQSKVSDVDSERVTVRLLLPMKVVGFVIGKGGAVINEIRKSTRADIQISKGVKPKCAGSNEELVEVNGGVSNVRDALVQIVTRLREDVLRENDMNPSLPDYTSGNPYPPPVSMAHTLNSNPLGYEYAADPGVPGIGMLPSASLYGYGPPPPMQGGENGYGGGSSYSSKYYGGGLVAPPVASAFEMLVPSNAVGKVMGKSGANIANIRNLSGASIEISDAKSVRGDRIALISGTPEQKKAAEGIIQAFIMSI